MAALPDMTSWKLPYSAKVVGQRHENGQVIVDYAVTIRWWHPRLWWMALRAIRSVWRGAT